MNIARDIPRETLKNKVDRVIYDRDLLRTIMGLELGIGAILFYVGLMVLMVIGTLGAGLAYIVLGFAIAAAGSIPYFKPEWVERWGFPDPI